MLLAASLSPPVIHVYVHHHTVVSRRLLTEIIWVSVRRLGINRARISRSPPPRRRRALIDSTNKTYSLLHGVRPRPRPLWCILLYLCAALSALFGGTCSVWRRSLRILFVVARVVDRELESLAASARIDDKGSFFMVLLVCVLDHDRDASAARSLRFVLQSRKQYARIVSRRLAEPFTVDSVNARALVLSLRSRCARWLCCACCCCCACVAVAVR